MKILHMVTFTLVIVGALNWGLVGLFDYNLVATLLGSSPEAMNVVYALVGFAGIYEIATHMKSCKVCASK